MIDENIKINPQPEEFDDSAELEPVTFVTEDGGEENFWHIMTFPYEGAKYAALVPEDQIDEEEPEVFCENRKGRAGRCLHSRRKRSSA